MLAQLLAKHGLKTRVASWEGIAGAAMSSGERADPAIVCLSYIDTTSTAHMRYAVRRLRRRWPDAVIMLGAWQAETDADALGDTIRADRVVSNLDEALAGVVQLARSAADAAGQVPAVAMNAA
jgi:hypothetical protein